MEDWVKKWYKEGFEKSNAYSPKNNWKIIASVLNEWPAHWYKKNVNDIKLRPKYNLWDNIESTLQRNTPQPTSLFSFKKFAALVGIICIPFFLVHPTVRLTSSTSDHKIVEVEDVKTSHLKKLAIQSAVQTIHKAISPSSDKKKIQLLLIEQNTIVSNVVNSNSHFDSDSSALAESNNTSQTINPNISPASIDSTRLIDLDPLELNPLYAITSASIIDYSLLPAKKKIDQKGWYLGTGATLQKTSLLNPITQRSLTSGSSLKTVASLNIGTQLSAYNQVTNRSGISATIFLHNKKIQQYKTTQSQETYSGKTELDYILFGFNYHRRLKTFENIPLNINSITGVFAGLNTGVSETINNESVVLLQNGFRKFDSGISVGYEINYSISPKWLFYSDIVYQIGLINIFKGTEQIPSHFFHTQTSSLNFSLGLKFKI